MNASNIISYNNHLDSTAQQFNARPKWKMSCFLFFSFNFELFVECFVFIFMFL